MPNQNVNEHNNPLSGNPNNGNNGNNGSNGNSGNNNQGTDDCNTCNLPMENCSTNRIEFKAHNGTFYSLDINCVCMIIVRESENICNTLVITIELMNNRTYTFYTNKRNKKHQNTGGGVFLDNNTFINLIKTMKLDYSDFGLLED